MNIIKRVGIGIKRQKGQFVILIIVSFIMGSLVASAIVANQAIVNTDVALRAKLPAIAIIHQDEDGFWDEWMTTGIWPYRENLTISILQEIGSLPYVRSFNYVVGLPDFFSEKLVRVWYPDLFLLAYEPTFDAVDDRSLSMWYETNFEQFVLTGIGSSNIMDIEASVIEFIAGRTFTDIEMEQGISAVVVSQSFLNINNLSLGDTFAMEHIIFDFLGYTRNLYSDENMLAKATHEFEIIGVFDRELPNDITLWGTDIQDHISILNQIFVPATFIERAIRLELEVFSGNERADELLVAESLVDLLDFGNIYFLLYDPLYLPHFHFAANEILPNFWMISDYSFVYADIAQSMAFIGDIADNVAVGAIVAMVLILGLIMLIFLYIRKMEIGIYLALGEKKRKIIVHLLLEMIFPIIIGLTISLFVGNMISSEISNHMLRENMHELYGNTIAFGDYEIRGIRIEVSHDEMIEMFEVRIDSQVAIAFYSIVVGTILVSSLLPLTLIFKMNPKDILIFGQI